LLSVFLPVFFRSSYIRWSQHRNRQLTAKWQTLIREIHFVFMGCSWGLGRSEKIFYPFSGLTGTESDSTDSRSKIQTLPIKEGNGEKTGLF
jgi:hypothetical protein